MPNVLDCYLPKMFWLSWENRQLRVGHGFLYKNVFMEWTDTDQDSFMNQISHVEMYTDEGVRGDWIVSRASGKWGREGMGGGWGVGGVGGGG